jgi:outer membrane lipoprotein carrier protein
MARRTLAAAALIALAGSAANGAAAPSTALEHYLTGLDTLSTEFTQTVTDAHGNELEAGSGSLTVQRPDRFRWDYRPRAQDNAAGEESGQLMVADGKNLWFYDRELAQVTVKPLAGALSSTPIMLLSSTPEQLQQSFQIMPSGTHDGLQWVDVKPRSTQADFSSAELGFQGQRLARMIVHDNLGQTVRLDFSHSGRDVPLAPTLFQFKPPSGVDVIGTAH